MKYVFASRMGHVKQLVNKLGIEAIELDESPIRMEEDFIIFTYTDGNGIVPESVENFLNANAPFVKGVVASGSMERHPSTFCFAADIIAKQFGCDIIAKVDGDGSDSDIETIKTYLANH